MNFDCDFFTLQDSNFNLVLPMHQSSYNNLSPVTLHALL